MAVESTTNISQEQKELQCVFRASVNKRAGGPSSASLTPPDKGDTGYGSHATSHRSRRAHTKSRYGCKNCKSRRLKCDESVQHGGGCWRCKTAGLNCDYLLLNPKPLLGALVDGGRLSSTGISNNTPSVETGTSKNDYGSANQDEVFSVSLSRQSSPVAQQISWSPNLAVLNLLDAALPSSTEILYHFTTMTASTVGDTKSQIIAQSRVVASALQSSYLMHAILGLAAAHLRYLLPPEAHALNSRLKVSECFYWAKALEGFRRELAGPDATSTQPSRHRSNVTKANMDQLLSTVMFVSMHQFSLRDDAGAITDQLSAPRSFVWLEDRAARKTAIKWLGIQAGFKGLLPAMRPWLAQSFWLPIVGSVDFEDQFDLCKLAEAVQKADHGVYNGIDPVEDHFVKLCGISSESTDGGPYYTSLQILLWCRRLRPITPETFTKLLNFVSRMSPGFEDLLLDRDTRALLLLTHWLVLMLEIGHWWITSRSKAEVREMVKFLRQRSDGEEVDRHVSSLLLEPAAAVGLDM